MPLFRLQTLGSLSLHEQSGAAVPGHGSQRRRLALLAVLAASGDRGRSRDSLLALFWPDASPERARHSLEQLLYGIRTTVHNEAFLGVNPVSLNPEVIRSDVREFERAVAGDRLEDAIAEYRGSFLEGFVLPDSLEFEQWVDGERARLATAYARTLEALAGAAERRSDFQRAAEWWEKRASHDPYDSRVAQSLMRALDASGNRARAISTRRSTSDCSGRNSACRRRLEHPRWRTGCESSRTFPLLRMRRTSHSQPRCRRRNPWCGGNH